MASQYPLDNKRTIQRSRDQLSTALPISLSLHDASILLNPSPFLFSCIVYYLIHSLSFRNYTPLNGELKADDSNITTTADIGDTVEKKMEGVVERVIQEEEEKRAKDVDIFTLAPKKPNWDLKRDVEPKLLKLEKKTRAAIIELIRRERPHDLSMA